MNCPHCLSMGPVRVIESRPGKHGIRKRRMVCFACSGRFTHYTGTDRKNCSVPDGNHRTGKALAMLEAGME